MRSTWCLVVAMGLVATAAPTALTAQADSGGITVGEVAPDFALPQSTADSSWKIPARLRDFRGQTVVLAFFYKVRTGG